MYYINSIVYGNRSKFVALILRQKNPLITRDCGYAIFLGFTRPWWPSNVLGDRNVHLEYFEGLYGFILRFFFITEYETVSMIPSSF